MCILAGPIWLGIDFELTNQIVSLNPGKQLVRIVLLRGSAYQQMESCAMCRI